MYNKLEISDITLYSETARGSKLFICVDDLTKLTPEVIALIQDRLSSNKLAVKSKTKPASQSKIAYEKAHDPTFLAFVEGLRTRFNLYPGNFYIKRFSKHRQFFYRTLAYRLALNEISQEDIEHSFSLMERECDFSILDFLNNLNNTTYTVKAKLMDFIVIMCDGVVSFNKEKLAINSLLELLDTQTIQLTDIEDCWYWMHEKSGMNFGMSLTSVPNALAHFSKHKQQLPNGRFVGGSANSSTGEKSVENLKNRDYNANAQAAQQHVANMRDRFKFKK